MTSPTIFKKLLSLDLDYENFAWLHGRGLSDFELLISVILTQNTNWQNVLKALENLKKSGINDLEKIEKLHENELAILIKPSGFFNVKARRLKNFIHALLNDFYDLENFKNEVSREWLLNIKGLGLESVDSILNYLCRQEILVVDSYTFRLAKFLNYDFETYEDLQEFFMSGIEKEKDEISNILKAKMKAKYQKMKNDSLRNEISLTNDVKIYSQANKNLEAKIRQSYESFELYELYQIYHALIIAFGKIAFKGYNLTLQGKEMIEKIKE